METRNKKRLTFPNFNIRRGWGAKIRQNFFNLEIPERGVKCPSLCKRCIPFQKTSEPLLGPSEKLFNIYETQVSNWKLSFQIWNEFYFSDLEKKAWRNVEKKKKMKKVHTHTQSANSISSWLLKATQNNQHFC